MKLTPAQIKQFDELGYLFFPSCFNEEEIALLRDDAEAILKLDRQEIWRENRARRAPHSPPTPSTRRFACWPRIRG